jgi:hypothetical protein
MWWAMMPHVGPANEALTPLKVSAASAQQTAPNAPPGLEQGLIMLSWVAANWGAMVALTLVAALALPYGWGQWRWAGLTHRLHERLQLTQEATKPALYEEQQLASLPPVVQRYFRAALQPGMPMLAAATVQHRGSFNMGEQADQWKPFTSHQRVVMRRPGFVWDARVRLLPGVAVHVHDAYLAGEGVLHPALFGLVSLADLHGGGELARGELMRFLAETPWYPTALLPSEGVRWQAIDERSAIATLSDSGITLSMTFTFGADGLIEAVRAEARGRTVGQQTVMRPWEGRYWGYTQRGGMQVPLNGEVAWLLPAAEGGRKPYWRGIIVSIHHEPRL